jgi:hypothetical protein
LWRDHCYDDVTKLSKIRSGGIFLWHCPRDHSHWALPSVLLCGARTFLVRSKPPAVTRAASPQKYTSSFPDVIMSKYRLALGSVQDHNIVTALDLTQKLNQTMLKNKFKYRERQRLTGNEASSFTGLGSESRASRFRLRILRCYGQSRKTGRRPLCETLKHERSMFSLKYGVCCEVPIISHVPRMDRKIQV